MRPLAVIQDGNRTLVVDNGLIVIVVQPADELDIVMEQFVKEIEPVDGWQRFQAGEIFYVGIGKGDLKAAIRSARPMVEAKEFGTEKGGRPVQRIVIAKNGGFALSVKAMKRAKELGAAWATNEEIETTDELERRGGWIPDVERDDPILVQVVEELRGEAPMKLWSELWIMEVPDGVEWQIEECEGYEWIAEKHRTWGT